MEILNRIFIQTLVIPFPFGSYKSNKRNNRYLVRYPAQIGLALTQFDKFNSMLQ